MNKKYAWIDIETTGLDPEKESILEVYVRITDAQLKTIDECHCLVKPPGGLEEATERMTPYVREMHEKNGLLKELQNAERTTTRPFTPFIVGEGLGLFLQLHNEGEPKSLYIAGSSVKFDWSFLEKHMPKVLEQVHYRCVDVSSTRVQMEMITGEDWVYPKTKGHRAKEDIDDTIGEYQFLWDKFAQWVHDRGVLTDKGGLVKVTDHHASGSIKGVDLWGPLTA